MIKFYDDKGNFLASYSTYEGLDEIKATKDLLEYENNCEVLVIIEH